MLFEVAVRVGVLAGAVAAGESVKVAAIDGLTLKVTRSAQRP